MKKRIMRIASLVMAVCMLFGNMVLPAQAANPGGLEYLNTYVNTGNQREDILGIALTQMGYTEKDVNDTKFGDWCGYPYQPWCAAFVSWCARQADISTDILKRNARAHPGYFDVTYYHGSKYTPKPGDLFFTEGFTHVGLVWYVEGDFFYSVEGNAKYHDYTVPDDPNEESYYVMSNKRLISKYYFGVPEYEGGGKDHDYVKGYDSAHPHKAYYKCSTCGDKYYTGYTECVASCSKCFTCGCTSSGAGYYLVSGTTGTIKMRTSHSSSADYVGYATVGESVYVHGTNTATGWAYIEYDGLRGHIPLSYLTKYCAAPAAPKVTANQTEYIRNETATVSWTASSNAEQYRLKVFRNDSLYLEKIMDMSRSCKLESLPVGEYEVQVIACNRTGASKAGVLEFTVRDTYTVTYDARGGSGAPAAQSQTVGEALTISSTIPVRQGYTFLGWTDSAKGNFAVYNAGASLSSYSNITLYAVWKSNDAVLQTMTIERMPACTVYMQGEKLDTTGLALRLTYSDGSGHVVTEGYSTAGFDSETYGTKTITVTYDTMTVTYDVQVVPYMPGDIDLNKVVDRDDVMQLLWHISFPEKFPIEVPADFNSDGTVNRDDVMQLLWHVAFPDRFPLEIEWPEEETPAEPDPGEGGEETPTDPGEGDEENPTDLGEGSVENLADPGEGSEEMPPDLSIDSEDPGSSAVEDEGVQSATEGE